MEVRGEGHLRSKTEFSPAATLIWGYPNCSGV
nr:MAG TPA: hypothetical protein [Caudoviricetes sp.]